jgi:hypothetical protein
MQNTISKAFEQLLEECPKGVNLRHHVMAPWKLSPSWDTATSHCERCAMTATISEFPLMENHFLEGEAAFKDCPMLPKAPFTQTQVSV